MKSSYGDDLLPIGTKIVLVTSVFLDNTANYAVKTPVLGVILGYDKLEEDDFSNRYHIRISKSGKETYRHYRGVVALEDLE